MDARGSLLNAQSKKLHTEEDTDNGKDRISNLPEAIRCCILSYLPIRDAVRIGIVSTKWKNMWTLVTNMVFKDNYSSRSNKTQRSNFMTFVDRVLLLHENPTILKFTLQCFDIYDTFRVKTWITSVIRLKKVQMLDICYKDESFVFPPCLFDRDCDSLIELKLDMPCILKVPTDVHFSRLKNVELYRVVFSAFVMISFNFPTVEVFKLVNCVWLDVKVVNIEAPVLKSIVISNSTYRWLLDDSRIRNSKYGWVPDIPTDFVINIHGQSLTNFECKANFTEDLTLPKPSLVVDAVVDVADNVHKDASNQLPIVGLRSCSLLKQLSSVKFLTISNVIVKALAHSEDLLASMPTFEKLTHLKLFTISFDKALIELLWSFPVLESLTFAERILNGEEDYFVQGVLPQCIVSHLKFITVKEFVAKEHEINLVKFLLGNAEVLEELSFNFGGDPKIRKNNVKKQLCAFPKVSSSAKLVFRRW